MTMTRLDGIPVLMYHGIAAYPMETSDAKFWVAAPAFLQQLEAIRSGGYRCRRLSDFWGSPRPVIRPGRDVVLTFDDGRASDYEAAFPLLAELGMQATFFVNTSVIGTENHLSWSQIVEMQRHGMVFQSHSHEHVALPPLGPRSLEQQLRTSRRVLEDRLGTAVHFFAPPYGLVNRRVLDAAWEAGYRGVCNSWHWPARPGSRVINRAAIYADTTGARFNGLLERQAVAYLPGLSAMAAKEIPKRVLLAVRPTALGVAVAGGQRA
jgi:peptidoglycan/xylan/chitin deacetylase (PgdA/CDA1 family)